MDRERIEQALKILEDEGRKAYRTEDQLDIPAFRAIGQAVAAYTNSATHILDLAYSALEDHNYHDLCAVIEWAHSLYGQTFHKSDLQRLQRMINKNAVTVRTEWNDQKAGYDTKRVNVRIVIEETGESQP